MIVCKTAWRDLSDRDLVIDEKRPSRRDLEICARSRSSDRTAKMVAIATFEAANAGKAVEARARRMALRRELCVLRVERAARAFVSIALRPICAVAFTFATILDPSAWLSVDPLDACGLLVAIGLLRLTPASDPTKTTKRHGVFVEHMRKLRERIAFLERIEVDFRVKRRAVILWSCNEARSLAQKATTAARIRL